MSAEPTVRIGQGVDVHAFADHGVLRLGGVRVPDAPALAGHSDGDALLHAVADALLGAAGLGDLGDLVGVDDPDRAGADSAGLLAEALAAVRGEGLQPSGCDATVICQRPRIAPHRPAMRRRLAELLGLDERRCSVKATTTDGLGALGSGDGVACLAVVLLTDRGD